MTAPGSPLSAVNWVRRRLSACGTCWSARTGELRSTLASIAGTMREHTPMLLARSRDVIGIDYPTQWRRQQADAVPPPRWADGPGRRRATCEPFEVDQHALDQVRE